MFHVKHPFERAVGRPLSPTQLRKLAQYRDWLADEALAGGGIGPGELDRLEERHVGGSLAYGRLLPPGSVVHDIGTGVGLPGVPLAIAFPERTFVLVDRSGRRIDLLDRALRLVGVENASTLHRDASALAGTIRLAVARAVFQPHDWTPVLNRILVPGGVCLVAVAGDSITPPSDSRLQVKRHEIGAEVLDPPVSFLTMTKRE